MLWTGDSFYQGPIWLYAPETQLDDYANTLDRLIQEIPHLKALLPAHNTPWVRPSILLDVKRAFDAMLAGKIPADRGGDGTAEYRLSEDDDFSFLMRDEPLPYGSSNK